MDHRSGRSSQIYADTNLEVVVWRSIWILSIPFFVMFLFYILEIVREIADTWEVMVGTRGQWVVILFTLFLSLWVTNPGGGVRED